MADPEQARAPIVDYYAALELALSAFTSTRAEYRRHFGYATSPAPAGYCWFKAVLAPERHPEFNDWLIPTGTELESRLLADWERLRPRSVLDVGCGNGALLKRLSESERGHGAELTGINLHPQQVRAARSLLAGTAVKIVEADFMQHGFSEQFELVYLVESAFHLPDKPGLCQRIARALRVDGEAWLLDIVVAERAAGAFGTPGGRAGATFSYVSRAEWQRCFAAAGLVEREFVDLSDGVARFLQVSDIALLRDEYFAPRLRQALQQAGSDAEREARFGPALKLLMQIATEYRRLSRLLQGGMLQYVLMRYG